MATRSCASRIAWETQQGLRVLIAVLFGDLPARLPDGTQGVAIGLPDAPRRHAAYASLQACIAERIPEDEDTLSRLAVMLGEIARLSQARQIYAPLGVGEHIDHRLGHEAALRVFQASAGRNTFFYEEQPQASLPGAVRLRLASVGAQLPPAASGSLQHAGWLRMAVGAALATQPEGGGLAERLACARAALRQRKATRGWRPLRALGARLQPVDQEVAPQGTRRFWLLLPEREASGAFTVAPASPAPRPAHPSAPDPAARGR